MRSGPTSTHFSCRTCSSPNSSSTAVRCVKRASKDHHEQLVSSGGRLQHWAVVSQRPSSFAKSALGKTVPLGLHGDAGPVTKQDSTFVIYWNSLLRAAANNGFGRRWLFAVIRKNDLTEETLDALWEVFGWSMNVLLSGILPERDWSGNDVPSGGGYVAEGWRGSLVQIRGDWEEFLCSVFRFP